jgi:hypothetical protein
VIVYLAQAVVPLVRVHSGKLILPGFQAAR